MGLFREEKTRGKKGTARRCGTMPDFGPYLGVNPNSRVSLSSSIKKEFGGMRDAPRGTSLPLLSLMRRKNLTKSV